MVTLATAVDADDTTWHLSEALPAGVEYILAEDELVAVVTPAIRPNQREDPTLYCEVVRGWEGPRASHAQGITLETLENPPLGGGGGTQTVRLLGPFPFAFDTTGLLTDPGAVMTDEIPSGATITTAWAEITEDWEFPGPAALLLRVFPNTDPSDNYQVTEYDTNPDDALTVQGDAKVVVEASNGDGSEPPIRLYQVRVTETASLCVRAVPETPSEVPDSHTYSSRSPHDTRGRVGRVRSHARVRRRLDCVAPHRPRSVKVLAVGMALDTNGQKYRYAEAARKWGEDPDVLRALAAGHESLAGVPDRYAAASADHPGLAIRSAHKAAAYFDFPFDIRWSARTDREVFQLAAEADVIHLTNDVKAYFWLRQAKARKPAVLHHHGTLFRNNPERLLAEARRLHFVQAVSTHDLLRFAPDELDVVADLLRSRRARDDPYGVSTAEGRACSGRLGAYQPRGQVHRRARSGRRATPSRRAARGPRPRANENQRRVFASQSDRGHLF